MLRAPRIHAHVHTAPVTGHTYALLAFPTVRNTLEADMLVLQVYIEQSSRDMHQELRIKADLHVVDGPGASAFASNSLFGQALTQHRVHTPTPAC